VETVKRNPKKIFQQQLIISESQEEQMKEKKAGMYFDWAPNSQNYLSHIDTGPRKEKELTDLIKKLTEENE